MAINSQEQREQRSQEGSASLGFGEPGTDVETSAEVGNIGFVTWPRYTLGLLFKFVFFFWGGGPF